MSTRLVEVRTFVSQESDIEGAMATGSPVHAVLSDGRRVRIHITSLRLKKNGLYGFTGTIADQSIEGIYGNASKERPQKFLAGFGMAKWQ